MKVYVYALTEPSTDAIRYVGVSVDPWNRFAAHVSTTAASKVGKWVRGLGQNPGLRVLECCDGEVAALAAERAWIARLKADGVALLNTSWGGTYPHTRKRSRWTGFGARVKAAREAAGLTQKDLAKLSGVTQPMLSRIESEKRPHVTAETAVRLARALGSSAEWFVTGETEPLPAAASAAE